MIIDLKPETFTLNWKYDKEISKDEINRKFEWHRYILKINKYRN